MQVRVLHAVDIHVNVSWTGIFCPLPFAPILRTAAISVHVAFLQCVCGQLFTYVICSVCIEFVVLLRAHTEGTSFLVR